MQEKSGKKQLGMEDMQWCDCLKETFLFIAYCHNMGLKGKRGTAFELLRCDECAGFSGEPQKNLEAVKKDGTNFAKWRLINLITQEVNKDIDFFKLI